MRTSLFFLLFGLFIPLFPFPSHAQELNCTVRVDIQALSGTDFTYLLDLEEQIEEYLNERAWTEETYQDFERIECNITITFVEALSNDQYRTHLSLVTRRPIYGTTQKTTVLQINDGDWQFKYVRNQPLLFDLNRFDPLTSTLDYYAYLILGYDYDTFLELGGTPYFEQARRIAELAQVSGQPAWLMAGNDRSRASLINTLLSPQLKLLRKAYFDYHFGALDHFILNPDQARTHALEALKNIHTLYQTLSRNYPTELFFSVKYQEIVSIFEDADNRRQVYGMLLDIDPAHLSAYNRLNL